MLVILSKPCLVKQHNLSHAQVLAKPSISAVTQDRKLVFSLVIRLSYSHVWGQVIDLSDAWKGPLCPLPSPSTMALSRKEAVGSGAAISRVLCGRVGQGPQSLLVYSSAFRQPQYDGNTSRRILLS